GRARGGTSVLLRGAGASVALARAYLGDQAFASATSAPAIAVRAQRYFLDAFALRGVIPIGAAPVSALAATMDYRSDVLVAWQQNGAIYARMLRASGRADPTQRLGASAPDPQLRALVSDNDHGMVAWSTRAGPGGRTSVFLDLSDAGVRFRAPARIASFADPAGAGQSAGALALVRLSSENVLLAWTGREHGRYVVRAAPAVFAATRPSALLSDARTQAVLSDLAAGPAGEAVAVWRASHGAAFDPTRAELWSTRAYIARHDRPGSSPPERLAAAGLNRSASVGVDPANDHAVVAWLAGGASVEYASAAGTSGYRPRPLSAALPRRTGETHWLWILLAALAAVGLAALGGVAARRRRHAVG
ncbi:MAG TPA: LPXTG cell wall anchor domain-containing protein, partial [Solirubrobacteraceae bacterium]|nr:LPXTG cell wall anchor domain-containing protein [Solirubrobacteraceae bacterium]